MLAENIIKIAHMDNHACYKELQKLGFSADNVFWKNYLKQWPEDTSDIHQKILMQYLCEQEIREASRKAIFKPSQKKAVKAIEKFLEGNKRAASTKGRPVFWHYYRDGENIVYTNCHMLGVITKADSNGVDEKYNLSNIEATFPDYKKVIPVFDGSQETTTIKYEDVLAIHKMNKLKKDDYDICIIKYGNNIGAYRADYLLHCFDVLGAKEITMERKDIITEPPKGQEGTPQNLQAAKVTAEGKDSYFVITPIRLSSEQIKAAS